MEKLNVQSKSSQVFYREHAYLRIYTVLCAVEKRRPFKCKVQLQNYKSPMQIVRVSQLSQRRLRLSGSWWSRYFLDLCHVKSTCCVAPAPSESPQLRPDGRKGNALHQHEITPGGTSEGSVVHLKSVTSPFPSAD